MENQNENENELKKLTETWMEMERKTLAQRERAEAYYEEYLMHPIIDYYLERNAD